MIIELSNEESKLLKLLLSEELGQVNVLIETSDSNDKEELQAQAEMMKVIIAKL